MPAMIDKFPTYDRSCLMGMRSFREVGGKLREIHTQRLYKKTHKSFGKYVRDQWHMSDHHARKLIRAAVVVENLEFMMNNGSATGSWGLTQIPTNMGERVIDPLLLLEDPADQFAAFQLAVDFANGKRLTGQIVQITVEEYMREQGLRCRRTGRPSQRAV